MGPYVPRVVQLDAVILDSEFFSLLKNQIFNVMNSFNLGNFTVKYAPELQALIKFLIWKLSTHRKEATIGQTLMGIRYSCDKSRLKYLFLLEAVIPYLYERCLPLLRPHPLFQKVKLPLKYVEDIVKIFEILNFIAFLVQNKYPTLVNRILNLRMSPALQFVNPSVVYSHQLRVMLWHQFADFLMIVLPIISIHKVKRYLSKWKFRSEKKPVLLRSEDNSAVRYILKCCICEKDAILPQHVEGCVFCYYCFQTNTQADPDFHCTTCVHAK